MRAENRAVGNKLDFLVGSQGRNSTKDSNADNTLSFDKLVMRAMDNNDDNQIESKSRSVPSDKERSVSRSSDIGSNDNKVGSTKETEAAAQVLIAQSQVPVVVVNIPQASSSDSSTVGGVDAVDSMNGGSGAGLSPLITNQNADTVAGMVAGELGSVEGDTLVDLMASDNNGLMGSTLVQDTEQVVISKEAIVSEALAGTLGEKSDEIKGDGQSVDSLQDDIIKPLDTAIKPTQTVEDGSGKNADMSATNGQVLTGATTLDQTNEVVMDDQGIAYESVVADTTQTVNTDSESEYDLTTVINSDVRGIKSLDMDNVNIKVAEAYEVDQEIFTNEISNEIILKANEKVNEFHIDLNPKHLGRITIKMVFEAGQTIVSMNCANAKTQSLLAANAEGIRAIIQSNVGTQTVVTVSNEQQPTDYRGSEDQANRNRQSHPDSQQQEQKQTSHDESVTFINRLRLGLINLG